MTCIKIPQGTWGHPQLRKQLSIFCDVISGPTELFFLHCTSIGETHTPPDRTASSVYSDKMTQHDIGGIWLTSWVAERLF